MRWPPSSVAARGGGDGVEAPRTSMSFFSWRHALASPVGSRSPLRRARAPFLLMAFALIAALCAPTLAQAQDPSGADAGTAQMTIDPQGARIGEPLTITLAVAHGVDETVLFPELSAEWGDFEIASTAAPETLAGPNGAQTRLRVGATAWMTGSVRAPDVRVRLAAADGSLRSLVVPGAAYNVSAVLQPEDLAPRPSRPPIEADLRPAWQRYLVAGILVAALLGVLSVAVRRFFARPEPDEVLSTPSFDAQDAREQAHALLDRAEAMRLPAAGRFRQHYSQVTECLRAFLEVVHGVPALERTTRETDTALRATPAIPGDTAAALIAFLNEADQVKFAGWQPGIEAAEAAIPRARILIDGLWAVRTAPSVDTPADGAADAPAVDPAVHPAVGPAVGPAFAPAVDPAVDPDDDGSGAARS